MKKIWTLILLLIISINVCSCQEKTLPLPEIDSGMRGELGIDKNINEKNIDDYLNRSDSVYRDMRMLKDEANYEAIGGDSYLSGIVKGFEVIPFPYLCNVEGLPEEVGSTYSGITLFSNVDGEYVPNFEESQAILERFFPKDKYIFLMCGGGGYAGMTKKMLVALGWDETKIYNVGGYWYYEGKNNIRIKNEENGIVNYDYSKLVYHDIDFSSLKQIREITNNNPTVTDNNHFIELADVEELNKLEADNKTFALYVYLPGCTSCAEFYPILSEYVDDKQIQIYSVMLNKLHNSNNSVSSRVSFSPSVFLYVDGKVVAYLNPESDEDLNIYKSIDELDKWFTANIDLNLIKSEDCVDACAVE